MTRTFKRLLTFLATTTISLGMVYTYIVEPGIGWATNLATGLFVGWVALRGLGFLSMFIMVFILDNKAKQKTVVYSEKELAEFIALRDAMTYSSFGSFLGYINGILVVGSLAVLGWYWTIVIWLLFFEVGATVLIKDIRKNIKIIDDKLQGQREKEERKAS